LIEKTWFGKPIFDVIVSICALKSFVFVESFQRVNYPIQGVRKKTERCE